MEITLTQSPFQSHDNLLFRFAKMFLIDQNIYDVSEQALPYTDKQRKYKLKITGITGQILVKHNDIDIISYDGTGTDGIFEFYVNPVLGRNEFKVTDTADEPYCYILLHCYNIHSFLAFTAYKFKTQWNKLYQGLANRFILDQVIQDLDGNYLTPDYNISKDYARLLGTKRYSKFTNSEYFTFLHGILDVHNNGGKYLAVYKLQEALTTYIAKIDVLQLEQYQPQHVNLTGKVYGDGTNNIKIYPGYIFQQNGDWGLLPYLEQYELPNTSIGISDSTSDYSQWVITNGTVYSDTTNWGSLQVIGSSLTYIPGLEFNVTDVFTPLDIFTDGTDGTYTGFSGSKYVTLRNTVVDGSSLTVTSIAPVTVDESFRYVSDYNLVDLGTMYSDGTINISYKTFDNLNILAKTDIDGTSLLDIQKCGHLDKSYLSYRDDNFGTIVVSIKARKYIDDELKNIIDDILKYVIPAHIKYYVVYSLTGIWDYAGQTNVTLDEIENANASNVVWTNASSSTGIIKDYVQSSNFGITVDDGGEYELTTDDWGTTSNGSLGSVILTSVKFSTTDNIVVVGKGGAIFYTPDSGANWTDYTDINYGDINDLIYIPQNIKLGYYYACTSLGTVLKSQDKGKTWYKYSVNATSNLTTIDFLDAFRGVVADSTGKIYQTKDGITYTEIIDLGYQIHDIKYLSPNLLIAVGVNYISKIYLQTEETDTETYFTNSNLSIQETFNKLAVYDLNRMYVVGDNGTIMRTLDGGDNWTNIIVADVYDYTAVQIKSNTELLVSNSNNQLIRITMDNIWYEPIKLSDLL